jgi:g-D-glutamyl-meso-diaminopimelate peptidase
MQRYSYDKYGFDQLQADITRLEARYPGLKRETIGSSVMGRSLYALRIGSGARKIHINASFHANEWITTAVLMKFLEDCLSKSESRTTFYGYDTTELLRRATIWTVPMVNPDGVELSLNGITAAALSNQQDVLHWNGGSMDFSSWKANIRGVDLNDQYPAGWELERDRRTVHGPSSRDFGGETPLSEPEAIAMADFVRRHDFDAVIAIHTQGEEIYWNYRDFEPAHAEQVAERLEAVSGYRAVKLTDSDAGFKDWFIQEFRRPGFTIELGFGVNPLPIGHFPSIYDKTAPLLLEGLSIL